MGVQKRIDRRKFLKWSGIAAGALTAGATGLVACGPQQETEACPTSVPSPTSEPCPEAECPSLKDKRVGLSSPINIEVLNEFYADMQVEASKPENQIDLVIVDAEGDPVKQLADMEAFIAQDYDAFFFLVTSPQPECEDIAAQATAKGMHVFNHSASAYPSCTNNTLVDEYDGGYTTGEEAARWINEKHGGEAEVGIQGNRTDPMLGQRTQGLIDAVLMDAPNATIVGEVEALTTEEGVDGAANLLQAHPDMSVLLSFSDSTGIGAYTAVKEAGKTNPDEFFLGSCDGLDIVLDAIAEGGVYQCTTSFLFAFSSTQWMRDMQEALRGNSVPRTRWLGGLLVTGENLEEVQKMVEDVQSPEVQYLFKTLYRYSNEPTKLGW